MAGAVARRDEIGYFGTAGAWVIDDSVSAVGDLHIST